MPEVETIKKGLEKLVIGYRIVDILADSPKQILPSLKVVKGEVIGLEIAEIKRRAKLMQVFLKAPREQQKERRRQLNFSEKEKSVWQACLLIHLKMTGRLLVRKPGDPGDEYQRVVIGLEKKYFRSGRQIAGGGLTFPVWKSGEENNLELRFCDLRKFGWIKLVKGREELEKIMAEFGPEPLDDLTFSYFKRYLASTRRPVKLALLNQKKISGIGNIYANDSLFLAKIDPRRPACGLKEKEVKSVYQSIHKVLRAGIKYRGASDQHYLDALGQKGAYQKHFLVYKRDGKKCFSCSGKIRRIKIGGRGTFYCPRCQN